MSRDGPRNKPYQCDVPSDLHARVIKKTQQAGVNIAPFVRQVFVELDNDLLGAVKQLAQKQDKEKRK